MTTATKSTIDTGSPAFGGAVLSMLLGIFFMGWGLYGLATGAATTTAVTIALIGGGLTELLVSWGAIQRKRAGWAFACSINGVMAVIFLFGMPKLRDGLGIHIALAAVPFLAFTIATFLLASGSNEFE